jgi:integrase
LIPDARSKYQQAGALMARQAKGTIDTITLADELRAFHLRFRVAGKRERVILHEIPGCVCGCGGGWDEPAARTELGNILARVRVGVWERPQPPQALAQHQVAREVPTFAEYAEWWLQAKIDGVLGDKPISENTISDYRWRLNVHLLPFFGRYRLDEIDRALCLEFKARKLREADEQRKAIQAGADLRDHRGRGIVPLGPASIRKLTSGLASILDDAIEDEHIDHHAARGKRMRVHVPKPNRTFLEMDELACVLDAAAKQDRTLDPAVAPRKVGPTTALVAHLLAQGKRPGEIANSLGVAKSTVTHHLRQLGATVGRGYVGRRVVCEILGRSGPRVGELCDIRIGHVRLHDPEGARFRIPDAKTETGIREVQISPDLVEVIIEHIDQLRRAGRPTGPNDYLMQNLKGGKMSRQRAAQIVGEAARRASEELAASGLPPLPRITPHSLRRTYISIALLANNFDVKWVMGQVGHADSKMTLDVYAQLEQRVDRSHGTSFDRLIRNAREQVAADLAPQADVATIGPRLGHEGEKPTKTLAKRPRRERSKTADLQRGRGMARPGFEPGTPRFSVVCSTN